MVEVVIDNAQDWLEANPYIHVEGFGRMEVLCCNRHGDVKCGDADNPVTINITAGDVTLL